MEAPPGEDQEPDPDSADQERVARSILLSQLTGQARSRHELAARLRSRNVPEEVAGPLLDRFEEVGLIDDEAFARLWVESRQRSRGLAPRALAVELRRKGVADDTVRDAVAEASEGEEHAARRLVRGRLPRVAGLPREVALRRLVGMLARKGYGPGLSLRVVAEELGSVEPEALCAEAPDLPESSS